VAPAPNSRANCDNSCQGLKKVLEERWTAFKEITRSAADGTTRASASSGAPVKLPGAATCAVNSVPQDSLRSTATTPISRVHLTPATLKGKAASPAAATQYVCYWPEDSVTAAQNQFQALVSVLEFLIPSTWSAHQLNQSDELSGAQVTVWSAHDASDAPAVRLYLSGQSVGLHVAAASE
jgi:hypothetical protein